MREVPSLYFGCPVFFCGGEHGHGYVCLYMCVYICVSKILYVYIINMYEVYIIYIR